MVTAAAPWLVTTTSRFPSRLKSPTATAVGVGPAGSVAEGASTPVPSLSSTCTLPEPTLLVVTTSSLPSPLKWPTAAAYAPNQPVELVVTSPAAAVFGGVP